MDAREFAHGFEAAVFELLRERGADPADFFGRFPAMETAMWTNAHARRNTGKTPADAAANWFAECVAPKLGE